MPPTFGLHLGSSFGGAKNGVCDMLNGCGNDNYGWDILKADVVCRRKLREPDIRGKFGRDRIVGQTVGKYGEIELGGLQRTGLDRIELMDHVKG